MTSTPKASITTLSAGRHNEDVEGSYHRILQSASWKRARVIVMIPAGKMLPSKVALSHWNLIFPPNNGVFRMLCQGMEVGDAYTQAIDFVINHPELRDWEYILTLEHDNIPPADGLIKLIARMEERPEFACIGGLYYTKGEGGVPQIWGDVTDPVLNFRPQPPDLAGGVKECCGTGMGFNLWRVSTFRDEKLRRPWFVTLSGSQGNATQDLYFWMDARKYGFRCAVDCSVLVGHYDVDADIVW